jgi:hypothetical protein
LGASSRSNQDDDLSVDERILHRLTESIVRLEKTSEPNVCNLFRFVYKVFHQISSLYPDREKSRFVWKRVPLPPGVVLAHTPE